MFDTISLYAFIKVIVCHLFEIYQFFSLCTVKERKKCKKEKER